MRLPLQLSVAAVVLAGAATAQGQMRFQGLDKNGDGVITRSEWRGNDNSFRHQDWNGDGILSGDEVRTGARRQTGWGQDWNRDGRVDNVDSQIAERFRGYDMNSDDRVARSEWPGDGRLFARLDANRDGYLSVQEYTQGGGFNLDALGGPSSRFSSIDSNSDGLITRNEWNMSNADFNRLDVNRDSRISRFEFEKDTAANDGYRYSAAQFNTMDANHDGWLVRGETRMDAFQFDRFDANDDNRISRQEFENFATSQPSQFNVLDDNGDGWLTRGETPMDANQFDRFDANDDNRISRQEFENFATSRPPEQRSAAWRSGYDRGTQEGRAAGREDYNRRQGWDLDGQRELERADSGYTSQLGRLSDYQAGYRDGFRSAYRSGFTEAGGRPPR
jgi:Ca2+-binding EF-hand superfamily protein